MDEIKICFDPGHYGYYNQYGYKPDGEKNWESKAMLDLGLQLYKAIPNSILTRYDDNDISLTNRGKIAADYNCEYFISLHTNANPETTDKSVEGLEIYYSVDIPNDKMVGEYLISIIEKHTGIKRKKVVIKVDSKYPNEDYYTVIDSAQDRGVPHVFLIEFGSHWQFSADYDNNIKNCVKAFKEFFGCTENNEGIDNKKYTVDVNSVLNMRDMPSMSGNIITKIPADEIVTAIGAVYDDWMHVKWNDYTGWVYGDYLSEIENDEENDESDLNDEQEQKPDKIGIIEIIKKFFVWLKDVFNII